MNALRRVIKFLGPYKRDAIVSIILQTLAVGVGLLIPRLVQVIIDQGVTPKNIQIILNTSIILPICML